MTTSTTTQPGAEAKPAKPVWTGANYDPAGEAAVLDLLRESLGPDSRGADPGFWQWKHFDNPFGRSFLRTAVADDGDIIGLRAFSRWRFEANGAPLSAVRAVDTATSSRFRRAGIFSTLTKAVVQEARDDGVDFVYNTPNGASMPGYLKMGWSFVANVRPQVRVLRPFSIVAGLAKGRFGGGDGGAHSQEAFFKRSLMPLRSFLDRGDDWDRLLDGSRPLLGGPETIVTARTLDYLRWRYLDNPALAYYAAAVGSPGDLKACAIFRTNTRFGLKEAVLTEVFLEKADLGLLKGLVKELTSALRADYLITHFPERSFLRRGLARNGFRRVPKMGMNFTVNQLNPELPMDPKSFEAWGLTMGDLELF